MSSPPRRPPWLFAVPFALVVAGLAGWLLLSDEQPVSSPGGAPAGATSGAGPVTPRVDVAPPPRHPGGAGRAPGGGTAADPGASDAGQAAADPGPDAGTMIVGRVVDPDGRPIPGAQVLAGGLRGEELGPLIALADGAGRFTLDAPPPTGLLEVVAERFARRVLSLEPGAGPLEVVLAPARAIEGRVVADEDERPLGGASVEGESATWRNRARTGPDGRFRFDDAPDEQAVLVVTFDGRKGAVVEAAEAALVRLSLGRALRGLVVDPTGVPVAGAMVFVIGADQLGHPHAARSDERGRFEVTGVGEDEAFAVLAFGVAPGGEELGTPLDLAWIEAGAGDEFTTTLQRARVVELRGAPADAPLALVPLACPPGVPAGAPRGGRRVGAALRFEGIVPGAWQLEAGGQAVGPFVEVPPGDPAVPVVVEWPADAADPARPAGPPRMGPLRVRVVDEVRRPVTGATVVVSVSGGDGGQHVRQTGPDGLVEWSQPPAGVLVVSASVPGRVLVTLVTLDGAATGEVELVLARPVTLEGRVRLPAPGGAAYVTLHGPDGAVLRSTETQPDGRFKLTDLAPGPALLEVTGDGCVPVELQVELPLTGELLVPLEAMGELHEH